MSFITGEYPDLLKIVKVIQIHKGGSTQDINNYRPISLSILDKIIEEIVVLFPRGTQHITSKQIWI